MTSDKCGIDLQAVKGADAEKARVLLEHLEGAACALLEGEAHIELGTRSPSAAEPYALAIVTPGLKLIFTGPDFSKALTSAFVYLAEVAEKQSEVLRAAEEQIEKGVAHLSGAAALVRERAGEEDFVAARLRRWAREP